MFKPGDRIKRTGGGDVSSMGVIRGKVFTFKRYAPLIFSNLLIFSKKTQMLVLVGVKGSWNASNFKKEINFKGTIAGKLP